MKHLGTVALLAVSAVGTLSAQGAIKAADLVGTWQVMTTRNLTTGAVDSVSKTQVYWMHFTPTRRFMIRQDLDRKVIADSAYARLSADDKVQAIFDMVFRRAGGQSFAANAGAYTVSGNKISYTFTAALTSPPGTKVDYTVTRLDDSSLVFQQEPTPAGVIIEFTARRIE